MISLDDDSLSGEIAPALSQSSSGGDQRLRNSSVPIQRSHGTTSWKADLGSRATHRSTPTRSHPGDLVGKYGYQASATDLEALPFGPNPPPGYPSLGTLLQNRSPPSGSKRPVDRPSSSNRSDRSLRKGQFSSHRSTDWCTLNILPGARVTWSDQMHRADWAHRSHRVNTGQKAQEVQDTQLLDRSELLVLNSPVRPVQLEHNVHESFDLLNSDSPDDRADESPERSILRHSGHRAPVTPAPVIPVTLALVIPVTPAPVTPVRLFLFFVLILVKRPGKQFFSHVEMEPPIPGYYQYFWGVIVSCSRKQHTDPAEDQPGSPDPEYDALTTRPVRSPVRL